MHIIVYHFILFFITLWNIKLATKTTENKRIRFGRNFKKENSISHEMLAFQHNSNEVQLCDSFILRKLFSLTLLIPFTLITMKIFTFFLYFTRNLCKPLRNVHLLFGLWWFQDEITEKLEYHHLNQSTFLGSSLFFIFFLFWFSFDFAFLTKYIHHSSPSPSSFHFIPFKFHFPLSMHRLLNVIFSLSLGLTFILFISFSLKFAGPFNSQP